MTQTSNFNRTVWFEESFTKISPNSNRPYTACRIKIIQSPHSQDAETLYFVADGATAPAPGEYTADVYLQNGKKGLNAVLKNIVKV